MTAGSCAFIVYANVPKVEDERICPVCGEPAPQNEVHHAHYGGLNCYRYFAQVNAVSDAIWFWFSAEKSSKQARGLYML